MRTLLSLGITLLSTSLAIAQQTPRESTAPMPITALKPADVFGALNLDYPGLQKVKAALASGDKQVAWNELILYYQRRNSVEYEPMEPVAPSPAVIQSADAAVKHIFSLGMGYPPQSYGLVVDWSSDPVHDIEWVAGMERFYWQHPLIAGYRATHNEKYARVWMDLTADWIAKHPVDPPAFDWLDIQVGIRATNMCAAFNVLRHSPSMKPKFLAVFLASIHDHATKMALYPRLTPHNKAVLEDMGLVRCAIMFPEFRESQHWLERAYQVFEIVLPKEVNNEGVQMEWTPSYHTVVASEMARVLDLCIRNHKNPPEDLMSRTRKTFDYWLAMTAPDHYLPMFGDTVRDLHHRPDFSVGDLAAHVFHRPEFGLLAREDFRVAPSFKNRAFLQSGMFFLRSGWQVKDIYLALHNVPAPLSGHDQPDNGTFALYGYGRWLMPDSGSYAYENTPHADERPWFRQTKVHQTLTLDGQNSVNAPRTLLWKDMGDSAVVTVENASYPHLIHRRTVFFVDNRYFVFLDEAIGDAKGPLDLHFQFAPGPFSEDGEHSVHTAFAEGGNVAVWEASAAPVDIIREKGQISFKFNIKEDRPAIAYRAHSGAPFVFLTVVVPYTGTQPPKTSAALKTPFAAGGNRPEIELSIDQQHWSLMRDLASVSAAVRKD